MPTGRLKFYDGSKGWGFLIPDELGPDVFVSRAEVEAVDIKKLKPLQRLSYEMGRHPITDRPVATKIRLVDEELMGTIRRPAMESEAHAATPKAAA